MATKQKSKPRNKTLTYLLVLLLFLFVSFSYYAYQIMYTDNVDTKGKPTYVRIRKDQSYEAVMDSIEAKGVIIDKLAFRFMAKLMNYDKLVKPGHYQIPDNATNYQLIGILRSGRQTPIKLTFNNIRLKDDLAAKLAGYLDAEEDEFREMFNDEEYLKQFGFTPETIMLMFIPNTYELYWNTTPEQLMERMKKEYDKFWTAERIAKAKKQGLTKKEVSVLASIVEAEQNQHPDERPRIAGAYLNRLKRGMALEADPTVVFAVGDFSIRRVLNKHLQTDSPYNTYKYKGLPPGPINLPAIPSIDAVLNPENHKYIYFCAKEDFSGYHSFAETFPEHLANARRYQKALTDAKIMK
ncbi:endolytic transglycosylase MltG [Adhaeribacter sp. BT258]|uniref:Endolytic murein transglycosylase n=1 Tax=Adhaeribacter terrigena TaxID=2793070 RepID=A0ABS1BXJ4_9BACT|nr:endolytic transglycosylase MltG [Adhaeribacter terrigena]MBK0401799.1 endolytic transglycosylase MltG [Adhaeribacter terrigena]